MKIVGFICTFNEEGNIVPCIESLKGVDEIIVADGGSTDKTRELAKKAGAKVFIRDDRWKIINQDDIKDFTNKFGWEPSYKIGDKVIPGPENLIRALSYIKDGWVLSLDADERLTWNEKEIRKLLDQADQISCNYIFSHEKDGSPTWTMKLIKLYRKGTEKLIGNVHGTIIPQGRQLFTDKMKIDHYPKWDGKRSWGSRKYVLPNLEYSVLRDDNSRNRFYLGREYYHYARYKECINLIERYLDIADWWPEIAMAYLFKAKAYWYWKEGPLNRGDLSRAACFKALEYNPDYTELLKFMGNGEVYFEPWATKWRTLAKGSKGTDVLFYIDK